MAWPVVVHHPYWSFCDFLFVRLTWFPQCLPVGDMHSGPWNGSISHDWQINLKAPRYFLRTWHRWIWTVVLGNATSSRSTKWYNSQHQSTCITIFKSAGGNKSTTTVRSECSSGQVADVWFIWRFGISYACLRPAWAIKAYGSAEASFYCGSWSKRTLAWRKCSWWSRQCHEGLKKCLQFDTQTRTTSESRPSKRTQGFCETNCSRKALLATIVWSLAMLNGYTTYTYVAIVQHRRTWRRCSLEKRPHVVWGLLNKILQDDSLALWS